MSGNRLCYRIRTDGLASEQICEEIQSESEEFARVIVYGPQQRPKWDFDGLPYPKEHIDDGGYSWKAFTDQICEILQYGLFYKQHSLECAF